MTRSRRPLPAYRESAAFYDAIYSFKDYAGESRQIGQLVRRFGRADSRTLLDVACGTGNHLVHLRHRFRVTGAEPNPAMRRVARRKLPGVPLVAARMETLDLGRSFDVVTCLFSAIGYVRSERDLRKTLTRLAAHVRPGGVVIVEPWIRAERYRAGRYHAQLFGTPERPIARMNLSLRRGARSILDMHHLVATDHGVRHWVEHHDLGLFSARTYRAAFRAAGLVPHALPGWQASRGLYVGVRPEGGRSTPGSSSARRPRGTPRRGGSRRRTASSASARSDRRRRSPSRRS